MNKEEIERLKNKLISFKDKDVYIEISNSIHFHTTIENAQIIVSNQKLFITDGKEKDFIIELHYLDSLEEDGNTTYLKLYNEIRITLDC